MAIERHPATVGLRLVAAALALTAVVAQVADLVARDVSLANFFSYFTIQSNVLAAAVLVTAAILGAAGRGDGRLTWWRGTATLAMTVTGVVYALLLRDVDVQTSEPWINTVLHYVMPVAVVADWVAVPPRRRTAFAAALSWVAFPLVYLAYSLGRGPVADWYPYPFLDPRDGGYGPVVTASAAILVFGTAVVTGLWAVARARTRPGRTPASGGSATRA